VLGITASVRSLHDCGPEMETARFDPLDLGPREERDLRISLEALSWLASTAVARWHQLDDEARLTLVSQVHEVASDLGRLARQRWDAAPNGDRHATFSLLSFLTPRELEVLRAIANGRSTAGIASGLGISPATVRTHVTNLLAKLGLHSRVEAVSLILGHGSGSVHIS
jgi:DNA-binding CsgD family transcriptional regulator